MKKFLFIFFLLALPKANLIFNHHEVKAESASYYFERATKKSEKGLRLEAIADFTTAIYLDPSLWQAFNNRGLDKDKIPHIKKFENSFEYKGMILEKNISLYSLCEHHFVPIVGKAHVGYFANNKIVGLSKLNRIVNYFSKRPQVQEKLTIQIVEFLKKELKTEDVACIIDAQHLCVSMRGVKDVNSWTTTAEYSGKFLESSYKNEFLNLIISKNS